MALIDEADCENTPPERSHADESRLHIRGAVGRTPRARCACTSRPGIGWRAFSKHASSSLETRHPCICPIASAVCPNAICGLLPACPKDRTFVCGGRQNSSPAEGSPANRGRLTGAGGTCAVLDGAEWEGMDVWLMSFDDPGASSRVAC